MSREWVETQRSSNKRDREDMQEPTVAVLAPTWSADKGSNDVNEQEQVESTQGVVGEDESGGMGDEEGDVSDMRKEKRLRAEI